MEKLDLTDLVALGIKSEEDVVRVLKECFLREQYYVQAGDVLVTVKPWKPLAYVEKEVLDFLRLYKGKDKHQPLPPHPCSVAEKAVRNASDGVIIPLGESGSGKSSNIQMILHYLTLRCNTEKSVSKDEILAINKVLDLFCNAGTLVCSNSTRCLKTYEVFFDSTEQSFLGINVKISMFEKMRVISQIKGEKNFHIFHVLLNGLNSTQLPEYYLDKPHRYVSSPNGEEFCEENGISLECLERIGFTEKEIEDLLHVVSAIVLLGDLLFGESNKKDVVAFRNNDVLEKAATLIGIPCATLAGSIITNSKSVRGQKIKVSASCSKAMYECDRLAVFCYETLVMWIEARINSRYTGHSRLQSDYSLLLLDVFGWENYSICSFEQLCINTVNEALQSMYNAIVFKAYQTEMEDEDVYLNERCEKFDQPGSTPVLLKPKGLLDILHSSADSNSSSDQNLLKKFDSSLKKEPRYVTNTTNNFNGFIIEHFIDEVSYDITGFASRSKNWLNNNILTHLKGSKNKVVSVMAQERITKENTSLEKTVSSPSSSKKSSVVEKDWLKTNVFLTNSGKEKKKCASIKNSTTAILTMSLTSVLTRISSLKVYFIRCINNSLRIQDEVFDEERVLRQVRWSNLCGTVKTRLPCLNSCLSLSEFIARYRLLFFHLTRPVSPKPELFHSVLSKRFSESQYRVGKTKVFLSKNLLLELDEKLEKVTCQIVLIQKVYRGMLGRREYQNMVKKKNKYDEQRSLFLSQVTTGILKFHDHLQLQISEDQRRLKQTKLKEEQKKIDANEGSVTRNQPVTTPGSQDGRVSYLWENELITDETLESLTWCKILCFQRTKQLAAFSVKDAKVVIDGTNHSFTTDRIGFNSFPTPEEDKQMKKVKACIGRGVELYLATDGSLIAVRLCKNSIFVKGHFCEEKLLKTLGELSKSEESKVFDYRTFMERINYECHPARVGADTEDRCLAMCAVHLCFVRNSVNDDDTPCWVEIVLNQALDYVKRTISYSMERRREIQEKYHFQQPPELRIDSKIESISAKSMKLIRPSRYIETVKFKRKGWARKRVVSNPFLYGETSFSEDDKSDSTSLCSPQSSVADETVFESNEDICNSSQNEGQELYENVNVKRKQDKRQRSRSAQSSGASYADESAFESAFESTGELSVTSPQCERQSVDGQEKWQYFLEGSQVETSEERLSDCLKGQDGSRKVEIQNGDEDHYENVHIANEEGNLLRFVIRQETAGQQRYEASGHPGTGIKGRKNQEFYENVEKGIGNVEDKLKNVFKISEENEQNRARFLQEERESQEVNNSQIIGSETDSYDYPVPDYMVDDSVYTNLAHMQRVENVFKDENALEDDVYQVMNSPSHHETSYHTEELYVNYSVSSKQHLEQRKSETTSKNDVDFADEGSAKAFVPHRMSFPRL